MRWSAVILLAGCAPFVTQDAVRRRADPCAWSLHEPHDGKLAHAQSRCDARLEILGDRDDDAFGGSLAAVGDLTGDGLDDLAVGSPNARGQRGAVHVFENDAMRAVSVLHTSDATAAFAGAGPGDQAGWQYTSVDSRDGSAGRELVIAAPGNDEGGADAGTIYVALTADLERARGVSVALADLGTRLLGSSRYRAGTALAVVASVDGDPFEELVIGTPSASITAALGGAAFVVHSSKLVLGAAMVIRDTGAPISYLSADCAFGAAIAAYDGEPRDGRRTGLLVGAPMHPSDDWNLWGSVDWGRAWLLTDASLPTPGQDRVVAEPLSLFAVNLRAETVFSREEEALRWRDPDARMGSAVAVVPDMDGDGTEELVVAGAVDSPDDVVAFVLRGGDMDGEQSKLFLIEDRAAVRIVRGRQGAAIVPTVVGVQDLDGDGLGELLIGDPSADGPDTLTVGRVYVFSSRQLFPEDGAEQLVLSLEDAYAVLDGATSGSRFGESIAEVGDLDGDGYRDVAIGAPGDTNGDGIRVGRVLVYRGGP